MYEFFERTSFFYVHVTRKKAAETTLVRKKLAKNVDEIDGRNFFTITSSFTWSESLRQVMWVRSVVLNLFSVSGTFYLKLFWRPT